MDENKRKYFEFIQNIITRMNSNSFMIKGWSVTLTSAIIALAISTKSNLFLFIIIIPVIVFWILDTIYLQQEKKFRCLYDEAIKSDSTIKIFDLNIKQGFIINNSKINFIKVFWSKSLRVFYVSLMIVTLVSVSFFLIKKESNQPQKIDVILRDTLIFKQIDSNKKSYLINDTISVNLIKTQNKKASS